MDNEEPQLPAPVRNELTTLGAESALSRLENEYLMLAIFVRIQHLLFDEAKTLIYAMLAAGEISPDLLFAKAVVENSLGDHESALSTVRQLEILDPATMAASSKGIRRARMRAYIKARSTFATTGSLDEEGRAALEFYLRHGSKKNGRRRKKK